MDLATFYHETRPVYILKGTQDNNQTRSHVRTWELSDKIFDSNSAVNDVVHGPFSFWPIRRLEAVAAESLPLISKPTSQKMILFWHFHYSLTYPVEKGCYFNSYDCRRDWKIVKLLSGNCLLGFHSFQLLIDLIWFCFFEHSAACYKKNEAIFRF